jgi:hypothetical protein
LDRLATGAGKDIFVPVIQAANPEGDLVSQAASGLYKDVVPLIPFAPDQMKRQSARAMNTVREMALSQADPTGNVVQAGAGAAPQATISALKDAFNQEYENTAKNYRCDVPHDFRDQVETRIRAALPDVDDATVNKVVSALDDQMDRFSSGKATIDGGNLLNAKNSTSEQMSKMRGVERSALNAGRGVFDDIISDELSPDVLARYQGLAAPYSAFKDVSKAANMAKSKSGNFTPAQLAIAAKAGSPLQDLAQAAQGTLGQPMYGSSLRGPAALAYGTYAPVRAASVLAGGNLLATETVQRAMMGDTVAQEAIQKLIEAHPETAAAIQTVIRNAATTQAGSASRPSQ